MMLELQAITKTYYGRQATVAALRNVTVSLPKGLLVVLQGPSGCGKTTLLLAAGGLLAPDSGQVRLDGENLYAISSQQRASRRAAKIGFVFQQFHLAPYLNIIDNLLLAALALGQQDEGGARQRATELIKQFGLEGRAQHLPEELSIGEKQRTALARAMMNRPALLLADEPTGNLDEANATIVLDALEQAARQGCGVLIASHDARVAERSSLVWKMRSGELINSL